MKAILAIAALLATTPLAAEPTPQQTPEQTEVIAAVDAFFAALRSDDKTALARQMDPQGMIYIHDRMDPAAPEVVVVPVAKHLENWAKSPPSLDEVMRYDKVLVDGDMAQVWGPYRFMAGGETTHCGINSLSMVRRDGVWMVANTSFSMVPPEQCGEVGADRVDGDNSGADADEEQAVLRTVRAYLDAFIARDAAAYAELTHPDGVQFIVNSMESQTRVRAVTNRDDIASLSEAGPTYAEEFWRPEVRIRGDLAQVWAPYSFDIDGTRSHCGFDNFTLIRTQGRWRVANASWTTEAVESCTELGEPE